MFVTSNTEVLAMRKAAGGLAWSPQGHYYFVSISWAHKLKPGLAAGFDVENTECDS